MNGKGAGFQKENFNDEAAALAPAFVPLVERAIQPSASLLDRIRAAHRAGTRAGAAAARCWYVRGPAEACLSSAAQ